MFRMLALITLVACHASSSSSVPAHAARSEPPPPAEVPEQTACERYEALGAKVDACGGLSEEIRQGIEQVRTDTLASISESGMDGSTPVDREELCEKDTAYLLRVAKQTCGL